jgi:hypothetical protein
MEKIQEDHCLLHGHSPLTIILVTPHGLFNVEYLGSVHRLTALNLFCVS